jgi:activator of HSP90 ATPase
MQPMMENFTRRSLGMILGGLAMTSAHAQEQKPGTTIHFDVDFNAAPARIYEMLLDAKLFAAFSKDTAEIQPQAGAPFKLFGGRIEGRNVELIPNRRIVQAWRPSSWPSGVYSIARFELAPHASGTRIVFDHAGFTEDNWEHFRTGWPDNYWEPIRIYLKG